MLLTCREHPGRSSMGLSRACIPFISFVVTAGKRMSRFNIVLGSSQVDSLDSVRHLIHHSRGVVH